jgi:CelD/BcsL family acetyltransferase involved in cellulose biosynthesis
MTMRVSLVDALEPPDVLVQEWNALVEASGARAWNTPAWALGWRGTYRPGAPLRLVTVHEGSELIGLGPFYEVRRLGLRMVRFLGQTHQPNRLLAIPGRPEVVAAIWSELRERRLALDLYDLESGESLDALLAADGWYHFIEPADQCMTILPPPGTSGADFLRSRKGLHSEVARKRRMAEREGLPLSVVQVTQYAEIDALLPAISQVTQVAQRDRFKAGELEELAQGRLSGPVRAAAEAGRVQLTLVSLDGRPAAFTVNLVGGNTVQPHLKAYDTAFYRYSPGEICEAEALSWALERGAHEYDLGIGAGQHKRRWTDTDYQTVRVVAATSARSLAATRAVLALSSVTASARGLAGRLMR